MKKILVLMFGLLLLGVSVYAADGDLVVNGNLCVGGKCTSTLHVSGGLYGSCTEGSNAFGIVALSPATGGGYGTPCQCPNGYKKVATGAYAYNAGSEFGYVLSGYVYSCYKN